jgi:DnaD/phage-associated family protein
VRATLGYHRESFTCSIVKMAEMTGLSENGTLAGAEAAEVRGTIERITQGRKTTVWRICFSTSASEVIKKRRTSASEVDDKNATSASEVAIPQPVRYSRAPKESIKEKSIKESSAAALNDFFHQNISPITPWIADSIQCAIEDYSAEWVMAALKETALQGKHNWQYAKAILSRCKSDGVPPGTIHKSARESNMPQSTYRDLTEFIQK